MPGPLFMPGSTSAIPEPPEMLFIKRNGNTAPTLEVGDFVKSHSVKVSPNLDRFFNSEEIIIEGFYLGGDISNFENYRITDIITIGGQTTV